MLPLVGLGCNAARASELYEHLVLPFIYPSTPPPTKTHCRDIKRGTNRHPRTWGRQLMQPDLKGPRAERRCRFRYTFSHQTKEVVGSVKASLKPMTSFVTLELEIWIRVQDRGHPEQLGSISTWRVWSNRDGWLAFVRVVDPVEASRNIALELLPMAEPLTEPDIGQKLPQ